MHEHRDKHVDVRALVTQSAKRPNRKMGMLEIYGTDAFPPAREELEGISRLASLPQHSYIAVQGHAKGFRRRFVLSLKARENLPFGRKLG